MYGVMKKAMCIDSVYAHGFFYLFPFQQSFDKQKFIFFRHYRKKFHTIPQALDEIFEN